MDTSVKSVLVKTIKKMSGPKNYVPRLFELFSIVECTAFERCSCRTCKHRAKGRSFKRVEVFALKDLLLLASKNQEMQCENAIGHKMLPD